MARALVGVCSGSLPLSYAREPVSRSAANEDRASTAKCRSHTPTDTHTHLSKGLFYRPLQLFPPNAGIMGYLSKHIIFHCQKAARVAAETPTLYS